MFRDKFMKSLSALLAVVLLCFCVMPAVPAFCSDPFADYDNYDYYDDNYDDYAAEEIPFSYKQNSETGNTCYVYDGAGLFSQYDIDRLLNDMYQVSAFADVAVVTTDYNYYGYSETSNVYEKDYCSAFYDAIYQGGKTKDCVVFLIDMHTRWLYLYREGTSEFKGTLTEGKSDSITDNFYSYASDGKYYQCASEVMMQVYKVLDGQLIMEPMKIACNLLIGLSVSFLFTYLIASAKSKIQKPNNDEALKYAVTRFEHSYINDILTNTSKTYCPRSSGSGGGSGGGGGHSHGGGGGHRF